jgi:hypothetical protein
MEWVVVIDAPAVGRLDLDQAYIVRLVTAPTPSDTRLSNGASYDTFEERTRMMGPYLSCVGALHLGS